MKHNSKQFLALFMAASMAVAPVSGVYAEDQNAAVENAVNANVQEGSEAEQNETASNAGQAESSVTAVEVRKKIKRKQPVKEQILRRTKTRRRMRLLQSCQWSVEQPVN